MHIMEQTKQKEASDIYERNSTLFDGYGLWGIKGW